MRVKQPECNVYFWGITEEDFVNTLRGVYRVSPILLSSRGISSEDGAIEYARKVYPLIHEDDCYSGFEVFQQDLISQIGDLEFRLAKRGNSFINVWNESKQRFDTVSLEYLLGSLKSGSFRF